MLKMFRELSTIFCTVMIELCVIREYMFQPTKWVGCATLGGFPAVCVVTWRDSCLRKAQEASCWHRVLILNCDILGTSFSLDCTKRAALAYIAPFKTIRRFREHSIELLLQSNLFVPQW